MFKPKPKDEGNSEKPFLSVAFQVENCDSLHSALMEKIDNALTILEDIQKEKNVAKIRHTENLTLDKLRKQSTLSLAELLQALKNELTKVNELYSASIKNTKENNSDSLVFYLNDIAKLNNDLQIFVEKIPDKQEKKWLEDYIKAQRKRIANTEDYITNALDISIYQIFIPKEQYKNIKEDSKRYDFEGTTKTVGKGIFGVVKSVGSALFTPVAFVMEMTGGSGDLTPGFILGIAQGAKEAHEAVTRHGFMYKNKLEWNDSWKPIEWRKIKKINEAEETKPGFQTIYVVDGKNPKDVVNNGLDYHSDPNINKKGKLIFFEKLEDAIFYAKDTEHANKEFFHSEYGWRDQTPWTAEELKEIETKLNKQEASPKSEQKSSLQIKQ